MNAPVLAPALVTDPGITMTLEVHYTLRGVNNHSSKRTRIEFTRYADRNRAERLMRGVNSRVEWHVTPVRCQKWARLYDAGWDWDERGFFVAGNRWTMREALMIVEDRA